MAVLRAVLPHGHKETNKTGLMMRFRVRRYFLLLSLSGVLLVLALSVVWYAHFSKQLLVTQETQANVNMTRVLAKLIWSEYSGFIEAGEVDAPERMRQLPEVAGLDGVMADFLDGSRILKVKIYNTRGFNIYSTEHAQIGEDKSDNPGFQAAMQGGTISVLAYRNQFHAFEQTVADRNLLSTYMPLYDQDTGAVAGVFELYSDVTEMVQEIERTQRIILLIGLLGFVVVFGGTYWLVRRGERIIKAQYDELAEAKSTIERLAYADTLTGLPNRNSFDDAVKRAIAQAQRDRSGFALFYLDLDGFKEINDRHGHAVGDHVLRETAHRLGAGLRRTDQVFRMGGDEFTAIFPGVASEATAATLADKVVALVAEPIHYRGLDLKVTTSLGVSLYPLHGEDIGTLMELSDKAMYQAKQAGSDCYRIASLAGARREADVAAR